MDTNTGLTVNKGVTQLVSSWVLNAVDIDSNQLNIKFILEQPYSTEGNFLLVKQNIPEDEDPDLYEPTSDGRWEKVTREWTQMNILDMEVTVVCHLVLKFFAILLGIKGL